jgi:hypothetical protein
MMSDSGERTPPPEEDAAGGHQGGRNGAAESGQPRSRPAIVEQLAAINDTTPEDLARLALGSSPDETVPTAEGITLFKGERSQQHKASGSDKSLLALRIERIKNTPLPEPRSSDPPTAPADH